MLPRRVPLHALLHRAETFALTHSPSCLTPAYPPRISAASLRPRCISSIPPQIRTPSHRPLDSYTPDRIPNAAWPYLYKLFDKMPHLDPYFKQVDDLQAKFIERLREAVAIPSISSEDQRRPDVVKVDTSAHTFA